MIQGHFRIQPGNSLAPYVPAGVMMPGNSDFTGAVNFLADTGATRTSLAPKDILNFNIDWTFLSRYPRFDLTGIGGNVSYYEVSDMWLMFQCGGLLAILTNTLMISDIWTDPKSGGDPSWNIPSLLGRDVLNLCEIRSNILTNTFDLCPNNAEDFAFIPPQELHP